MNKIEKLNQELCPEGVKTRLLGELEDAGILKLGRGNVISKTDLSATPGDYPVYSSSAAGEGEFGRYGKFMFDDERITWSVDGGGRFFYRPPHKYSVTNVSGWIKVHDPNVLSTKYLAHVLFQLWATKTYNYTVKAHPSVIRQDYSIPVPPLEVQNEIVSILDKFTELEAELDAELDAELEARKRQFNYFVDELTSAGTASRSGGLTCPVGDLGEFIRGSGLQKSDLSNEGAPALHYGQIFTYYKTKIHAAKSMVTPKLAASIRQAEYGDVIIATTSENIEDLCKSVVWLGEGNLAVGGETFIFKHELDPLYATYLFRSSDFQYQKLSHISGTKVKRVSGKSLEKMTVSVPEREAQVRIGSFLSQLEDLLGDVHEGLPAEILARRKQYEYYRNKLLTFKELDTA